MKKITLLFFLFLGMTSSFSQQLYVEAGKTLSQFDYKNSQGNALDNLQSNAHTYMGLGFRDQILLENLNVLLGASYTGYGAIGSDDVVGNYMQWDMNYVEFNVGLDYKLFSIKKANVYLKGVAAAEFLVQGTQVVNNRVIDLKNADDFDKTVYDFRIGFGFSHPISDNLSFFAQYMHGKSLRLKDGTAVTSDQEQLRIISHNIGFGLLINLAKK